MKLLNSDNLITLKIYLLLNILLFSMIGFAQNQRANQMTDIGQLIDATCQKFNGRNQNTCSGAAAGLSQATYSFRRCLVDKKSQTVRPTQMQTLKSESGQEFKASILSASELTELEEYVSRSDKTKRYGLSEHMLVRKSTCAQRAMNVAGDLLNDCQVQSAKIFAQGRMRNVKGKCGETYAWDDSFLWMNSNYHVANLVYVEKNGKAEPYVIDRLLFFKAVPLNEWKDKVDSDRNLKYSISGPTVTTPSQIQNEKNLPEINMKWADAGIEEQTIAAVRGGLPRFDGSRCLLEQAKANGQAK